METGMRALAVSALFFGAIVAATSASATVYVRGKYHKGIYIRPHFLDYPGQTIGGPLRLPPEDEAAKAKEQAPGPLMLEPKPAPRERQPHPACVPLQGVGNTANEATLGTLVPRERRLLIVNNGFYGVRLAQIAGGIGV